MKNYSISFILISLFLSTIVVFGQKEKECKVLMPDISGTYKGKCKNGLAHGKGDAQGTDHYVGRFSQGWPDGKGTYAWANGDEYHGDFAEGKRDGEGTMILKAQDGDSILAGLWEKDIYMGPKPEKPKVITKYNLDRYSFQLVSDIQNRVLIDFMQNGTRNLGIENLTMATSSGGNTRRGNLVGFENIFFPVEIKVNYTTWNKMHTQRYNVSIEFKISEPGDWVVTLYN